MKDKYGNIITWVPKLNKSQKSIYSQLVTCIENDIEKGVLKCGDKLPAQRVIANYLNINHGTVTRAYKICEEKGLIKGIIGSGTFVTSSAGIPNHVLAKVSSNVIELGAVLPLYSVNEQIKKQMQKIYDLIDYNTVLKYSLPQGDLKHRYIASMWLKRFKIYSEPDNIIITSGSQNALAVILSGLFKKGDRIAVDSLTYTGIKGLASLLGIILVPIKADSCGMDSNELRKVCRRDKIQGIYLVPNCQNPTSITMPLIRRLEICEIIKEQQLLLIEDGIFSFLEESLISPLSAYVPEQSCYIQGLSKAFNPSLRISYIVASSHFISRLAEVLNNLTWMASPLNAELASLLTNSRIYDDIVKLKLSELKKRNEIFNEVMREFEFVDSEFCMFRYLLLPHSCSDIEIEHQCLSRSVQVFASKRFLVAANTDYNALRIAISAPGTITEMKKGLNIIKGVINNNRLNSKIII